MGLGAGRVAGGSGDRVSPEPTASVSRLDGTRRGSGVGEHADYPQCSLLWAIHTYGIGDALYGEGYDASQI